VLRSAQGQTPDLQAALVNYTGSSGIRSMRVCARGRSREEARELVAAEGLVGP
jgi:hypothetical protein